MSVIEGAPRRATFFNRRLYQAFLDALRM